MDDFVFDLDRHPNQKACERSCSYSTLCKISYLCFPTGTQRLAFTAAEKKQAGKRETAKAQEKAQKHIESHQSGARLVE
jgi:hypothetical protein